MAQKVTGTCTITRLRLGDTIYLTLNVTGSPCIFYDDNSILTNFAKNNLIIRGQVTSAQGAQINIVGSSWHVNGTIIQNGSIYEVSQNELKIKGNIYNSVSEVKTVVVEWEVIVESQGTTQMLTKTFEIPCVNNGANSYWGTVQAPQGTILSNELTSVQLTHNLNLGGDNITYGSGTGNYSVKWFINGNSAEASKVDSSGRLTINRDDVNGMAYVECEFYVNGTKVEADGITVVDIADELQILVEDHYDVDYNGTVNITPMLVRNRAGSTEKVTSGITWGVNVKNNYTMENVSSSNYTFTPSTGKFSMAEQKMYYTVGSTRYEFSPVVVFSAEV